MKDEWPRLYQNCACVSVMVALVVCGYSLVVEKRSLDSDGAEIEFVGARDSIRDLQMENGVGASVPFQREIQAADSARKARRPADIALTHGVCR